MNGTDERDLPSIFYTGTSYLGRPVSIGLQGETPTASPTAGASAIPVGAVGAQAPARPGDTPTGIPGVSSSSLLQALQALGLARGITTLTGEIGRGGTTGGAALDVEVPAAAQAPPAAQLPGEIGHEIIPAAEAIPGGVGTTEAIEAAGQSPQAAPAAEGAAAGTEAATLSSSGASALAALWPFALQQLVAQLPQDVQEKSWMAAFVNPAFYPLAIPALVSLFSGHGLPGFGPPPAMRFPQSNLVQLEQTVSSNLPAPLEAPPGASPEVKAWIDAANKERDDILANFSAANLSKTGLGTDVQSAESWRNIWGYTTADVQDRFAHLQGLYETALQGLAGLPVPADIPSYGGGWGRSLGAEKTLSAFPQLKTPPAKPPEKAMLPPPTFFRGTEKRPDEEEAAA